MTRSAIPLLAILGMASAFFLGEPVWAARAATKPATPAAKPVDPVTDLISQARAAQAKGDIDLALRLAQSAIVADPSRPETYVALGNVYAHTGQAEFARNYYDEALSIDPMAPAALQAMAALQARAAQPAPVLATP